MTSTENAIAQAEHDASIAQRRLNFVGRMVNSIDPEMTGVEWFEKLGSIRARGAQLSGSEKWDRVLRYIDKQLNEGVLTNRQIVMRALMKFNEAVMFPRV